MLVTLFGPPGVGKSTVGDYLHSNFEFTHIAIGRLLKSPEFVQSLDLSWNKVSLALRTGATISSPQLFDWLDSQILQGSDRIVIDGYPREPNAVKRFNSFIDQLALTSEAVALHLRCSLTVSSNRLVARGRSDDIASLIARRYYEYETVQLPILSQLHTRVQLVLIDAEKSMPSIFTSVRNALRL